MRHLRPILMRIFRAIPAGVAAGAALSLLVLIFGTLLLGVSGWFITATGIAGLAGAGIIFDVFRPSAAIRFLALGRTVARYGERLLTHDATLRALAILRVDLLKAAAHRPAREAEALRTEAALNRITADVDALDGVLLRLFLPLVTGLAVHVLAFCLLWWVVGPTVAIAVLLGYLPGAAFALLRLMKRAQTPAKAAEAARQALRGDFIGALRDRPARIVRGALPETEAALLRLDEASRRAAADLDRAERNGRAVLFVLPHLAAGLALLAGGWMIAQGEVGAAAASVGFFVALALAETLAALPRGIAETGRMTDAAERIAAMQDVPASTELPVPSVDATAPVLQVDRPGFSLQPGEALALTGPSGAGKTTLLWQIAGLLPSDCVISLWGTPPDRWPEHELRQCLTLVPQRTALISGSVRQNLAFAGTDDPEEMYAALEAVGLTAEIAARGGLDMRLGEGGAGLSGGQARRLAIARAILRRPQILLLDEPTEGLDAATANHVLHGLRRALPEAAILCAMHRHADHAIFGRNVAFKIQVW